MRYSTSMKLASIALSVAALGSSPASVAATATGALPVTALVLSTCVVAATPVVFGNYSMAARDATGIITVTCTPDILSYNVGLGTGVGSGATTTARNLTAVLPLTGDPLNYALYRDSNRTQNWGDEAGVDTVASAAATTDLGAIKTFTVYGRLAADQVGAVGAYADLVEITVNY